MATDQEIQQIIELGVQAKALTQNPAYVEAMEVTMERAFAAFMATSPEDGTVRDAIWATCNALREFQATIEAFISNGELEVKNREFDRKR